MNSAKASKEVEMYFQCTHFAYSTEGNAVEISDSDVVESLRSCFEKEGLPVLLTPTPMVEQEESVEEVRTIACGTLCRAYGKGTPHCSNRSLRLIRRRFLARFVISSWISMVCVLKGVILLWLDGRCVSIDISYMVKA